MQRGKFSRGILGLACVGLLSACGSGGGEEDTAPDARPESEAAVDLQQDDRVTGQSIVQARFGKAKFASATYPTEPSSGRYGTAKYR